MGDSMEKKINDFIVFCIEVFKEENKLTGKEVYELFEKYGSVTGSVEDFKNLDKNVFVN